MNNKYIIVALVAVIVLVIAYISYTNYRESKIDSLAGCLTQKKVSFYGASWCSHCKQQKELFGEAISKITYVECSIDEAGPMSQICIDKKILRYPTWLDEDGRRLDGVMNLDTLAVNFGCKF